MTLEKRWTVPRPKAHEDSALTMARSQDQERRIDRLLRAVARHPWARFEFLLVESGLSEHHARQARRETVEKSQIELMRIATKGQPHPPQRYGLMPSGAWHTRLPLENVNQRAARLMAAPHLEQVRRRFLMDPEVRGRLVWSISPWRTENGLTLDALVCMRNKLGLPVMVACAVPPENAAEGWWYATLVRRWITFHRRNIELSVSLILLGKPFAPRKISILADSPLRRRSRGVRSDANERIVFWSPDRPDSGMTQADNWIHLGRGGEKNCCPWDDPTLLACHQPARVFMHGQVPTKPHVQRLRTWCERSNHSAAPALRAALSCSHGEIRLLELLLRYPAFNDKELACLSGITQRTVRRNLRRLLNQGLIEQLPNFSKGDRVSLTKTGLDLMAYQAMQTPARFKAHRAWPVDHKALTHSPRHMDYILRFMFALQRQGQLANWDLLQARYGYCVALSAGDLTRPRWVTVVPDSSGVLRLGDVEVSFWLEIDRGTRHGRALRRQLEKYIQLRFAYAGSDPIPMLLYVVAEGGEGRARRVARCLVELGQRYHLRRTPAILISTWELLTNDDPRQTPDPLRPVWRHPYSWRLWLSPLEPHEERNEHPLWTKGAGHQTQTMTSSLSTSLGALDLPSVPKHNRKWQHACRAGG